MSRQARQQSQSGIYHLIFRGINKQVIFEEDKDREKFIWSLGYYKELSQCKIYAYCLMDNHIHLLIKEGKEPIGDTVKRIGVSYVSWFNRKYKRCGHLFQDRFKSEAVEDDEYYLMILRYIHQNPLKIGEVITYPWSSYREYIGEKSLVDTDFGLGLFGEDRERAKRLFKEFMSEYAEELGITIYGKSKMTDQEAKVAIQKTTGIANPIELQTAEKGKRNELIRKIKKIDGITTRQLARLTGITQSVIVRA
jgi:Transposase and inactivated derivatives